jgi:hypothetical protein
MACPASAARVSGGASMSSGPLDPGTPPSREPAEGPGGEPAAPGPAGQPALGGLSAYLVANRGRFTDEVLVDAAVRSGWSADAVRNELAALNDREVTRPIRARARRIVIVLYLVGYVVLVAAMLSNGANYGAGPIGAIVLTVALGIAFAIGSLWVGRKRISADRLEGSLPVLIALPAVLWLIVTGLCVATGLPFTIRS